MKRDEKGFPIAECYQDEHLLIVPRCPYCHGRHAHGAAGGLGHRVTDCYPKPPEARKGYVLELIPYHLQGTSKKRRR